jgi:hypothetical protein
MAGIFNRVLPKPIPKNYHKENLQMMKLQQQDMQNKIHQKADQPKQDQWKMKKYQAIESRVNKE